MAWSIDWKRSLLFSAILIVILYVVRYFLGTGETYCIVALVIFLAFFLILNLAGRRR